MELIGLAGEKYSGKNTAAQVLIENYGFKEYSVARPLKELVSKVFDIPYENLDDAKLKEVPFETPLVITQDDVYEIVRQCSALIGFESFRKSEESVIKNMSKKVIKKVSINPVAPQQQGQPQGPVFRVPEYKTFETPRKVLQFVGTDLVRDCISPYFWCKVLDFLIVNEKSVVLTDVRFFEEREYVKLKAGTLVKIERIIEGTEKSKDGHASENSMGTLDEYHYLILNDGSPDDLKGRLETVYVYSNLLRTRKVQQIETKE